MGKPKYQKAQRVRVKGFEPIANPRQAQGLALIARSSASGAHDGRAHRQRTRAASRHAEIRTHLGG